MDPLFLQYYNQELHFLREHSKEFAEQHPKVARRLGMQGLEVQDPYVERLLEGFAFMSARMQLKLTAEFPKFTKRLLDVIYPSFNCPTPAMGLVRMEPKTAKGDLSYGSEIQKGTQFSVRSSLPQLQNCKVETGFTTTVWPLEVSYAEVTGPPPDIVDLKRKIPSHLRVEGALRIRLKSVSDTILVSNIGDLGDFAFYIDGDDVIVSKIYELIHTCAIGYTVIDPRQKNSDARIHLGGIKHFGLEPKEGVLPRSWDSFHGHNLLHTYFMNPDVFHFFSVSGTHNFFRQFVLDEVEIIILLNRYEKGLTKLVTKDNFVTNCVPIINLFSRACDNIPLDYKDVEHHVVVSRAAPLDFEIHSILAVRAETKHKDGEAGLAEKDRERQSFRPLYTTVNADQGNYAAYYVVNRELRVVSEKARMYGTRTNYIGTEIYISLVDQNEQVFQPDHRTLTIEALVTNRDLPLLLKHNEGGEFLPTDSIPIDNVHLLKKMSIPRPPLAQREPAWKLIQLLGFNFHPLLDLSPEESSQIIRDLLMLFVHEDSEYYVQQINSLLGVDFTPITKRVPHVGPLVYARGTKVTLTIDEMGFSGASPYLFACIIERWLSKHVSINSFVQLELRTIQRGHVYTWPIRVGGRSTI